MNTKIIIRYGLFSAGILIIISVASLIVLGTSEENYDVGEIIGYTSIILSLTTIYFGIKKYKNEHLNGSINFWQALKVGLLIAVFPSITFGLYNVIYVEYIDPTFMDSYYQHELQKLEESMTATEYEVAKAEMESQKEMFMNPTIQFFVMFFTVWLIGLIITIVSSFSFIVSKPKQTA
ncbi:DUF4199 domain-containing protein [Fulvivirga sp. RKSG066]|uniref:DUF4199 domain-containing protein n=1 Tax=Fulvivirga aurantia TaxID=2529383 RepID=UPI0012BB6810|nr:DUF4199 domain-containing protein [Fulvivirga aurantia]MTI19733.1 DUF4199 domain-containing protein [Fulvivirga aurantia]